MYKKIETMNPNIQSVTKRCSIFNFFEWKVILQHKNVSILIKKSSIFFLIKTSRQVCIVQMFGYTEWTIIKGT